MELTLILSRPPRDRRLAHFIERFWACEVQAGSGLEQVLPHGRAQLLINLRKDALHNYLPTGHLHQRASGMAVQTPASKPVVIDRAEQAMLCGVSFSVGGAFAFFGGAMSGSDLGLIDLADLSWSDPWSLHERLHNAKHANERLDVLEAAFLGLAPTSQRWDDVVRHAVGLLKLGVEVHDVAKQCGTSQQTLITRFRERTGMTPKAYSRIERFQQILRNQNPDQTWAQAALDAGFSDQSHMVREFKSFAGVSPTSYQLSGNNNYNHIVLPT